MDDKNQITPEVNNITPEPPKIEETPEAKSGIDPQAISADVLAQLESKMPEIVEGISKKTREDIISKIIGEEQKKDEPYVPTSYEELMDKTVAKSVEMFEKKQQETQDRLKAEEVAKREEEQRVVEQNNEYWDKQLADLEKDGILPSLTKEIANKLADDKELTEEEKNDPSVKLRAELYAKSRELKEKGDADWWNFKYVAYKFRIGANRQDNPVIFKNSYSVPSEKSAYSYEDIHGKSFQDIAKESLTK